jgi:hypothetical protein
MIQPNDYVQLNADKRLVMRIDEYGKGLNAYEIDLVASCLERVEGGRTLSEKQREILERIDEDKVA